MTLGKPTGDLIRDVKWASDFQLNLQSTSSIAITVNRQDGNLIPELHVLDVTGKELAFAEHDSTFAAATIKSFSPPAAGTYYIVVSRLNNHAGDSAGSFTLLVSPTN